MKLQKKRKILAAVGNRTESKFEGDEEMEMVYLHCHDVTRPWLMTCDGLVCLPVPGCVNVLNPSTGKSLVFPSGPDPVTANRYVDGHRYVRMFFDPDHYCEILDVNIGEWRISSPPPYLVDARRKSACVNGSIYWLDVLTFQILALDLHTEEFRDVPFHNLPSRPPSLAITDQLVNLDDRLAISTVHFRSWTLAIWTMDAQEERWSMTYSIRLSGRDLYRQPSSMNFRPVTVTKQGNLFFHDNENRLFKYYPKINLVRWISQDTWVISPFVENLVPFEHHNSVPITSGYQYEIQYLDEHERINEQEELVNQRVDNVSSSGADGGYEVVGHVPHTVL
ncbi:Galactose oxidase/kelch beta-propeller [Arabidopsis suecica]|uniref:Galactose oxidase/kelch beta-propeller n=1 Tax=Arabidopsis suecica TaxID=45249 RepID=A0A8T1ZU62_ARASU|nr:Galactose oxidase/kelch beta-propeller [Arabidopsis suecica]